MQIVLEAGQRQREVDVLVEAPYACVADLLAAAAAAPSPAGATPGPAGATPGPAGVVVGGRFFDADAGLDEIGLHEGAVVHVEEAGPPGPAAVRPAAAAGLAAAAGPAAGGLALAVVDGPGAGALVPLEPGEVVVGRDPGAGVVLDDPSVSARHAVLTVDAAGAVTVRDLGSHNGTWLDGAAVLRPTPVPPGALLRLGASHARLVPARRDDTPIAVDPLFRAVGGLVPFNRPPRPALPGELEPIVTPEPPAAPRGSRTFSIVTIIGPLLMGGALIAIYGDPRFALFMLLSPVMAVGNYVAARRRDTKERRAGSREFRRALADLDTRLAAAVAAETARREQRYPDAAETCRRARQPSTRLWERRVGALDFLRLRGGIGDVPWDPPLEEERGGRGGEGRDDEIATVVAAHRVLPRAPVEIDLSGGGVVGIVGHREAALALARSLVVQAAVHHGPADLGIAVLTTPEGATDWDWAKWLPHTRHPRDSTRLLAADPAAADEVLAALLETPDDEPAGPRIRFSAGRDDVPEGPTRLVVLDDPALIEGRRAPARQVLRGAAGPAAGIVIAPSEDQLPAVTSTVVELRSDLGDADLRRPQEGRRVEGFVVTGMAEATAREAARNLARYEDPELELVGAGIPPLVRLLPLLGMEEISPELVLDAWSRGLPDPGASTPIGVGEDGVVVLDLVRDGPHGLIGGTTGSGKSELLRSLVAGMAARTDPDHLVFVLVDYKGGSAFDECARLPHTVGLVTDLDEHLGERALRSLEAELAHRERVLRAAGVPDLPAYLAAGAPRGPLPRLVVVIDEFATLAAELPDFLGALVGIAQRGRSLGVHLLLATQRPSGAVNANIKANTNLRIALRVQDANDSTDIIDRRDAATISRTEPGRAYVRLGPTDVVMVQTALSTAPAETGPASAVRLADFRFGRLPGSRGADDGAGDRASGPSDLTRLVEAVRTAFDKQGLAPPRRPWLAMLPERLALADVLAAAEGGAGDGGAGGEGGAGGDGVVPFALADEPERQRQVPVGWRPADGHLALYGMVGSGTTTALLAVARALAERHDPDTCHLYAVDFGAGGLAPLAELPHCGAVITAAEREGQVRLIRHLRREVDRRRALPPAERAAEPRIVVLVDGIGAFLAEHEGVESTETSEAFRRVFSDGPTVDLLFVVAGERPGILPVRLAALVSQKLLFRLADPGDFSAIGVRAKELPAFVPGRALHGGTKQVVQVGLPDPDWAALGAAVRARAPLDRPPVPIGTLPTRLAYHDLPGVAVLEPPPVRLPLGIADEDLGPAVLPLHPTDHATVAGPPRSGKSCTLALVAALVRAADPGTVLVGICDDRSPLFASEALDAAGPLAGLAHIVRAAPGDGRRWLILVDDAPLVDDVDDVMTRAIRSGRPGLHVVGAGRTDDLRGGYGHWNRLLRQSRTGVLLQPNLSTDGDVLTLRLPRRVAVPLVPGRGFVVAAGELSLAQIAFPPEPPR